MELKDLTNRQTQQLKLIYEQVVLRCGRKNCQQGFVKSQECTCRQVFRWVMQLVEANIPNTYWRLDIDSLDKIPAPVINAVIEYMDHFDTAIEEGLGFIFSGQWGIGKTALMNEIGKCALLNQKRVLYCLADDYIKNIMKPETLNTKYSMDHFDVLLLDELDKVYIKAGSDYSVREIEKLLRNRLPYNKPVIIGTNATEKELLDCFGNSTVSIIKRYLKFIQFTGQDQALRLQSDWRSRLHKKNESFNNKILIKTAKQFCSRNTSH